MAVPQQKTNMLPHAQERRRHQRVRVNLLGRYMLADRREFPCQVVNMSPGGMALIAPVGGNVGDRVIAYVDHLGRLEGKIARVLQNGFAMTISATPRKRDKLAAQLTWLANRESLGLPEGRSYERLVPRQAGVTLRFEGGRESFARIIDFSMAGAAIATGLRPAIGASARLPGAKAAAISRTRVERIHTGRWRLAMNRPIRAQRPLPSTACPRSSGTTSRACGPWSWKRGPAES